MRLYVNDKEIPSLKSALQRQIVDLETIQTQTGDYNNQIVIDRLGDLLERVELCEALQNNHRRSDK